MLQKYGSFENFPLPNYYFERSTHDRLQQGFCEKILRMNAEEQPNIVIDCGYQKQDSVMKRALHSQLTFVNSFVRSSETLLKISITSCDSVYKVPEQIEALNGSSNSTVSHFCNSVRTILQQMHGVVGMSRDEIYFKIQDEMRSMFFIAKTRFFIKYLKLLTKLVSLVKN